MVRALLVLLVFLASCQGPNEAYVRADRSTYDLMAPIVERYIAADETAAQTWVDALRAKLVSWRMRIEKAEASLAIAREP